MRILVTGSRDWHDRAVVWSMIEEYLDDVGVTAPWSTTGRYLDATGTTGVGIVVPLTSVVIVHGGCRTGADRMAFDWAILHGVTEETWAADWARYHGGAGPRRNAAMVKAGADVCLAFPLRCVIKDCDRHNGEPHWTHGTDDCVTRAEAAGIEVRACLTYS